MRNAQHAFRTVRRGVDRRSPRCRRALGALLLTVASAACAARYDPAPMPDPALDRQIRSEVEARLRTEPSLTARQIRVEVDGARVQLHGSVRGIGAWRCALRNASLVSGVEGVVDFLLLEPGPRDVTCLAVRS